MKRGLTFPALALLSFGVAGGILHGDQVVIPRLSKKLYAFTYVERQEGVQILLGTEIAKDRLRAGYLPIQISVANLRAESLRISPRSFHLFDYQGREYPLASIREVRQKYRKLSHDKRWLRNSAFQRLQFTHASVVDIASEFYPDVTEIRHRQIELSHGTRIYDLLYFRTDDRNVGEELMRLEINLGLSEPLAVIFRISEQP